MAPLRVARAVAALAAVAPMVLCCGGCRAPRRPKPAESVDAKARTVATTGVFISWQEPGPDGRVQPVLEVEAESGTVAAGSQSGTFKSARGRIYRAGVLRATFEAPAVQADQTSTTLKADGGVTVRSVQPAGVTLTSRTVVWRATLHKIVATGNVTFRQVEPASGEVTAEGGPFQRVTFNTDMQRLTIP